MASKKYKMKIGQILRIATIGLILLIPVMQICAGDNFEHFEKGDLMFREKDYKEPNKRHTGVYWKWVDSDPETSHSHRLIEALFVPGVTYTSYHSFLHTWNYTEGRYCTYRGSASQNPTAQQREDIVNFARSQYGKPFTVGFPWEFRGYGPWPLSPHYRCDGLAERAYQEAGLDIVPWWQDRWLLTWPELQQSYMRFKPALVERPEVSIDHPAADMILGGTWNILAWDVSDGLHGSGIAQVEFWAGDLNSTPDDITDTGIKLGTDPHKVLIKGDYSYPWNTASENPTGNPEFPDDYYLIFAKAFDQAGNTKISEPIEVIVNNAPPIIINASPTGQAQETKPTISATIVSEDDIVPIDLSSIVMSLDGVQVLHSATANANGCSVNISYTPLSDLTTGQHTVTIDAEDASALAANQKTWTFEIIQQQANLQHFLYIAPSQLSFNLRCPASSTRIEPEAYYMVMDLDTFEVILFEEVTYETSFWSPNESIARLTYEWVSEYPYLKTFVEPVGVGNVILTAIYSPPIPLPSLPAYCITDIPTIVRDSVTYQGTLSGSLLALSGTTTTPGCDGSIISFNLYDSLSRLQGNWYGNSITVYLSSFIDEYMSIPNIDPGPGPLNPPYGSLFPYTRPISEPPELLTGYFSRAFLGGVTYGQQVNGYNVWGGIQGKEQGSFYWAEEDLNQDGQLDIWQLYTTPVKATGNFNLQFYK